jgi:hypothetical protein
VTAITSLIMTDFLMKLHKMRSWIMIPVLRFNLKCNQNCIQTITQPGIGKKNVEIYIVHRGNSDSCLLKFSLGCPLPPKNDI